jgi:hypothetical protein
MSCHERNVFLTLTYDDEHLPIGGSLYKRDLQNFFKRLRKNLKGRKIKYYACGEYGETTFRPHYHAIIFGLGLQHEDKQLVIDSWSLCDWTPLRIKKSFGIVERKSINYVTKYIQKKLSGSLAEEEYDRVRQVIAPFQVCSRGLGYRFCLDNLVDSVGSDSITVNGKIVATPRYYKRKLEELGLYDKKQSYDRYEEHEAEVLDYYRDKDMNPWKAKRLNRQQRGKRLEAKNKIYKRDKI